MPTLGGDNIQADRSDLELDVVLISRNQRWNIERLIDSVRAETRNLTTTILLVDSASSDGTAEIASNAGIVVVRLDEGQHLCPSAGRHVGFNMTQGTYVLFLDGDAELVHGWLKIALPVIASRPEVGAITGSRIRLPIDTSPSERPDPPTINFAAQEVVRSGGSALYRRDALLDVGQFDPYLFSEEEPELALRLQAGGYKLLQTEYPIIYDYTDPTDKIQTVLARRKRKLYLGIGQILRKHWRSPLFRLYVRHRKTSLLSSAAILLWIMVLLASIMSRSYIMAIFLSLMPIISGCALALRRNSIYSVLLSAVREFCHTEGIVRGVLLKRREVEHYSPSFSDLSPMRAPTRPLDTDSSS